MENYFFADSVLTFLQDYLPLKELQEAQEEP